MTAHCAGEAPRADHCTFDESIPYFAIPHQLALSLSFLPFSHSVTQKHILFFGLFFVSSFLTSWFPFFASLSRLSSFFLLSYLVFDANLIFFSCSFPFHSCLLAYLFRLAPSSCSSFFLLLDRHIGAVDIVRCRRFLFAMQYYLFVAFLLEHVESTPSLSFARADAAFQRIFCRTSHRFFRGCARRIVVSASLELSTSTQHNLSPFPACARLSWSAASRIPLSSTQPSPFLQPIGKTRVGPTGAMGAASEFQSMDFVASGVAWLKVTSSMPTYVGATEFIFACQQPYRHTLSPTHRHIFPETHAGTDTVDSWQCAVDSDNERQ